MGELRSGLFPLQPKFAFCSSYTEPPTSPCYSALTYMYLYIKNFLAGPTGDRRRKYDDIFSHNCLFLAEPVRTRQHPGLQSSYAHSSQARFSQDYFRHLQIYKYKAGDLCSNIEDTMYLRHIHCKLFAQSFGRVRTCRILEIVV
jgi:hypothetical protein